MGRSRKYGRRFFWGLASLCFWVGCFSLIIYDSVTNPGGHRTIARIERDGHVVRLVMDSGQALEVHPSDPTSRAENLALLFPGKHVNVSIHRRLWKKGGSCTADLEIGSFKDEGKPLLDLSSYRRLVGNGFTDSDISNSFQIPLTAYSVVAVATGGVAAATNNPHRDPPEEEDYDEDGGHVTLGGWRPRHICATESATRRK